MASWSGSGFLQAGGEDSAEETLHDQVTEARRGAPCVRSFALTPNGRERDEGGWKRKLALVTQWASLALLLCAVVGCWRLTAPRRQSSAAEDVVEDYFVASWEPAQISWSLHPNKCWDIISHHPGYNNGMRLKLWDCDANPEKFIIPKGGFGPIKLAADPTFCLDAPRHGPILQFWKCAKAPRKHLLFHLPTNQSGVIRPAAYPDRCVDVPYKSNGAKVQLWNCSAESALNDMSFKIHWPVTCQWGNWSDWSNCSEACTTMRTRKQYREGFSNAHCDAVERVVNSCYGEDCPRTRGGFVQAPANGTEETHENSSASPSHSSATSTRALRGAARPRSLASSTIALLSGLPCLWAVHG